MRILIKNLVVTVAWMVVASPAFGQKTFQEMEVITVNEQVTTVVTADEPIRFVDISTDKVAGDQPMKNVIRLKPKIARADGDILGIYRD